MSETNQTQPAEPGTELDLSPRPPAVRDPGVQRPANAVSVFLDRETFEDALHMAKALAYSTMVPDQYKMYSVKNGQEVKNPDAMGNCVIALELAGRLRVSPLMVMQQVDMVKGRPGLRGAFCAALVNQSGLFERLDYEWRGEEGKDDWGCRAFAKRLKDGTVCYGPWVDMKMVKAEGWINNAKWKSMPEVMATYRAAAFFARRWAPDIIMGMQSIEEIEDVHGVDDAPRMVRQLEGTGELDGRLEAEAEGEEGGKRPKRRRRAQQAAAAAEAPADPPSPATEAEGREANAPEKEPEQQQLGGGDDEFSGVE